jgi:inner membrane protein
MQAESHAIISLGVAVGLATAQDVRSPSLFAGLVAASLFGALLPDVDHINSRISRKLPILAWPFWGVRHRGLTHSLIGFVGLVLLMAALRLPVWAAVGIMFGFVSHLVADMVTVGGVQLLWPLRWRVRLLPAALAIRTGSLFEPFAGLLVAGLFVAFLTLA